MEDVMEVLQKIGYLAKEKKNTLILKDCTIISIGKIWKQPKSLSMMDVEVVVYIYGGILLSH